MILYIGNKLLKHGNTPTSVDTIGKKLSKYLEVKRVSDKKNKILRLLDMLFSIINYRKNIDFILIDTYSTTNFYYAFFCSYLAKLLKLKYIPILRGGDLPNRLENSPKLSNIIFKNSYINIVPSNYLLKSFKNYNTLYIPNSIEIKDYSFKKRDKFRLKLLYVRAFSKIYNPILAIEVVNILKEEYPNIELCMVGPDRDGTLEKSKNRCEELNLSNNIKFMGKLSKEKWRKLSEEYDIFINTTNIDNTPISLIEAMSLGLAIVSTNVGGIPYLVENQKEALLVEKNNPIEMSNAIKSIINNQDKTKNMVNMSYKKAQSFDWEKVKSLWLKLLGEK